MLRAVIIALLLLLTTGFVWAGIVISPQAELTNSAELRMNTKKCVGNYCEAIFTFVNAEERTLSKEDILVTFEDLEGNSKSITFHPQYNFGIYAPRNVSVEVCEENGTKCHMEETGEVEYVFTSTDMRVPAGNAAFRLWTEDYNEDVVDWHVTINNLPNSLGLDVLSLDTHDKGWAIWNSSSPYQTNLVGHWNMTFNYASEINTHTFRANNSIANVTSFIDNCTHPDNATNMTNSTGDNLNNILFMENAPVGNNAQLTFNIWVRISARANITSGQDRFIMGHMSNITGQRAKFSIILRNSSNVESIRFDRTRPAQGSNNCDYTIRLPREQWHMITLVWRTNNLSGFVNGTFVCSATTTGSAIINSLRNCTTVGGTFADGVCNGPPSLAASFPGVVDEYSMWSRNLSINEISLLYTNYTSIVTGNNKTCTFCNRNWDVLCNDNCILSTNTDMKKYNLTFSGTGRATITANITNCTTAKVTTGTCTVATQGRLSCQ